MPHEDQVPPAAPTGLYSYKYVNGIPVRTAHEAASDQPGMPASAKPVAEAATEPEPVSQVPADPGRPRVVFRGGQRVELAPGEELPPDEPSRSESPQSTATTLAEPEPEPSGHTGRQPAKTPADRLRERYGGPENWPAEEWVGAMVGTVAGVSINGKFSTGTRFGVGRTDRQVVADSHKYADFETYASDEAVAAFNDFAEPFRGYIYNSYASPRDPLPYMVMTTIPSEDPRQTAVITYFPHVYRDKDNRPGWYVELATVIATQAAEDLMWLVKRTPDAAEMFVQQAAPGLERPTAEDDDSPGVLRSQTTGVITVPYEDIQEALAMDTGPFAGEDAYAIQHGLIAEAVEKAKAHPYMFSQPSGKAPAGSH